MIGDIVASPGVRKFAVKEFWDWVYHQNGEGDKENPQEALAKRPASPEMPDTDSMRCMYLQKVNTAAR